MFQRSKKIQWLIPFLLSLFLISCNSTNSQEILPPVENAQSNHLKTDEIINQDLPADTTNNQDNEVLEIDFIDVGQADCALLKQGDSIMMIDTGTKKSSSKIIQYLEDKNINKLDYLVGTHPHLDHIGGMTEILNVCSVNNILINLNIDYDTNAFQNLSNMLINKEYNIIEPKEGNTYSLGNASFEILSPDNFDYGRNANNSSIVIKVQYKENSFLFMADAEEEIEDILLQSKSDKLKSNVIKIGHHGSDTSSTQEFLNCVSPEIAVISVGLNNSYNHPYQQVLENLYQLNTKVYRTDYDGTIHLISNGTKITIKTNTKIDKNAAA